MVWLVSDGYPPREVVVHGEWRTFWTSHVFTQAAKDGADQRELLNSYGIYKDKPKEKGK